MKNKENLSRCFPLNNNNNYYYYESDKQLLTNLMSVCLLTIARCMQGIKNDASLNYLEMQAQGLLSRSAYIILALIYDNYGCVVQVCI